MAIRCRSSGDERRGRHGKKDFRQAGMDCRDDRSRTPLRGGESQVHHHPTPAGRSRGCLTGMHGGKVVMFRVTIVRRRVTVPIACSFMATMLPISAVSVDAVTSTPTPKGDF